MSSVNKVLIIGRLGDDPDIRYMPNGDAVTNLSVATSESWKDKNGEKQDKTEWHRVVMFKKLAEIAGEYLEKGSLVYIEGRLQTRKWQDKNGADRYTTEIIADKMQMLGGVKKSDVPGNAPSSSRAKEVGDFGDIDDDIPF